MSIDTSTAATRTLSCPGCGGTVAIRAAGSSVTIACEYCASLIDVARPEAKLITRYHEAVAALDIPLGRRGTLRGVEWEAIGYLRRGDDYVSWDEYLLFNPYRGYRWLIGDGRGWSFGRMLTVNPQRIDEAMVLDGVTYQPFFAESTARVAYVVGEFYWRVKVGEKVRVADWVRPGFMLSRERNGAEQSWTLAEWLPPAEIAAAFGAPIPPQWPGSGRPPMPHQPSPWAGVPGKAWAIAIALIIGMMIVGSVNGRGGAALRQTVSVTPDGPERSVTIGPVVLTRSRQAVTITARSDDVDNQWANLDYTLVDRATQATFETYGVVERYHGSDSDGSWSEGDQTTTAKIGSVPAGTYDLVVDAGAHNWTGGASSRAAATPTTVDPMIEAREMLPPEVRALLPPPEPVPVEVPRPVRVEIVVASGGVFWSNWWLATILILGPAVWFSIQAFRFQAARHGQSDFASGDGDDEE